MTVKEIVVQYLVQSGYDGLLNLDGECGCELSDLAPCDQMQEACRPGYKAVCTDACTHEGYQHSGAWHVQEEKP